MLILRRAEGPYEINPPMLCKFFEDEESRKEKLRGRNNGLSRMLNLSKLNVQYVCAICNQLIRTPPREGNTARIIQTSEEKECTGKVR